MTFEFEKSNMAWCPGCGNFLVLQALKLALDELDITPQNTVLVSGIGQAAKTPQYIKANYFNGLHGRAIPAALGIKSANKELNVIVVSGDGDIYGEGGNHFIHAIRKNSDISVFVCNNMVYGLTKGQASPTTHKGYETRLSPGGVKDEPFNPVAMAIAANASFVARAFCQDIQQTKEFMKQAILHKGFSLVDIFQPCVTFNKVNTYDWFKQNTYYLEGKFERIQAFEKSLEMEKLPLGIFYENQRETYEETLQTPLYKNEFDQDKLKQLIKKYCFAKESN